MIIGLLVSDSMGQVKKSPERSEVEGKFKWKLEDIYQSNDVWEKDYTLVQEKISVLESFKGKLGESAEKLLEFFRLRDSVSEIAGKLMVYSKMRKDEDTRNSQYQAMNDRIDQLVTKLNEATAFVNPELLLIPEEKLKKFLDSGKDIAVYKHAIDDLLRTKKHILSQREEELLAMSGEVFNSPQNVFSMLNNADIKFPVIKDAEGNNVELTKGNFSVFLMSKNREVRKNAWESLYGSYEKLINTLAASFSSQIKKDVVLAKARYYNSSLEAALFGNNIPVPVLENLVTAVHQNLAPLKRYVSLRKKILNLDEVHLYDVYVPLFSAREEKYEYESAKEMVIRNLAPLGKKYTGDLTKGFNSGWVDIYENVGKRSGAYSWGSYGTHPYILLNYANKLDDVFTLAHEFGHAMHSFYTWQSQPYVYGDYTIFLAEVASTTNEAILMQKLIKDTKDKQQKLVLLNRYLDNIVGTFYRQTMFAEFEKQIHEAVESGKPLTAENLRTMYGELYKSYYDNALVVDDQLKMEWARIPHFYYNFYVFQYATGFAAATALSSAILNDGQPALDRYLKFLSAGSSQYSIDILTMAGVDMTKTEPIKEVARVMDRLLDEVEATMK
ncbi:MAG: oligoendopeptidase F [Patescibacteria group bacterium]|nr:oligoendopeptidase F [Patescibacteria group bacterium]